MSKSGSKHKGKSIIPRSSQPIAKTQKQEPHSSNLIISHHKEKLIGSTEYCADNDNYSPHDVVEKMLMRRDRKIPGSVFKPHSEEIILLQSVVLGQP